MCWSNTKHILFCCEMSHWRILDCLLVDYLLCSGMIDFKLFGDLFKSLASTTFFLEVLESTIDHVMMTPHTSIVKRTPEPGCQWLK